MRPGHETQEPRKGGACSCTLRSLLPHGRCRQELGPRRLGREAPALASLGSPAVTQPTGSCVLSCTCQAPHLAQASSG